ncbi:hypothetical protein RQP46_007725 [Phenoliferia psychrophenolica]
MAITMRSSIESLRDVIEETHHLTSPSTSVDSKGTGFTGSTEAPGAATRSIEASISAHDERHSTPTLSAHSSRSYHSSASRPPPPEHLVDGRSRRGGDRSRGGATPRTFSSGSWSDVGLPSQPGDEVRGDVAEEDATGEDDLNVGVLSSEYAGSQSSEIEASIPVTDEQEVEGLSADVSRGPDSFIDAWVQGTRNYPHLGYGTSSHGGDDLSDAGRDDSRRPSSRLSSVTSSEIGHSPSFISVALFDGTRSPTHLRSDTMSIIDLESLPPSDIISVKLDDDEKPVKLEENFTLVIKDEDAEGKLRIQEREMSDDTASTTSSSQATVAPASGSRPWQGVCVLLVAALVQQNYPTLVTLLRGARQLEKEVEQQITYFVAGNITNNTFPEPMPLGAGFSWSHVAVAVAAVSIMGCLQGAYFLANSPKQSSASNNFGGRIAPRVVADKLDPAVATAKARMLLAQGERLYFLGGLNGAATAFEAAVDLAVEQCDKAVSNEWLGRTRYRQSRVERSPRLVHAAKASFERSIRSDTTRATPFASLGRALFSLGDYPAAEKKLALAIRRDATLAFAHEILGKTLVALGRWKDAELSLREAIRLDPVSYSTLAFLGEQLHLRKQPRAARLALEAAVALRHDYAAAHARLAMIDAEENDRAGAAVHWSAVLQYREAGCVDENLPRTTPAVMGATPHLSLYFSTIGPLGHDARILILRKAASQYPDNALVAVLLAANLRAMDSRNARVPALAVLENLKLQLQPRLDHGDDDLESCGVYALVLTCDRKEQGQAVAAFDAFLRMTKSWPRAEVKVMATQLSFIGEAFAELRNHYGSMRELKEGRRASMRA